MYRGGGGGGRYRGRGGSSSYRGGRVGANSNGHSARPVLRGLFADGIWQCDCSPRLAAEHFKVKKEGKNQGRWFYTCQNQEPKRCGFFLWDEDAKSREEAAVLDGRRTEPLGRRSGGGEVQEGWDAGRAQRAARTDAMGARGRVDGGMGMFAQINHSHGGNSRGDDEETASPTPSPVSPPPSYRSPGHASAANNSGKRNAQQAGIDDEDEEFFPWPLTGQEEQELTKAADTAAPQTPHKAQKTGVYVTPATTAKRKLPWLESEQVPKTPTTAAWAAKPTDGYLDRPSKRPGAVSPITETPTPSIPLALPASAITPSPPTRFKDALTNPAHSSSTLTTSALALLQPLNLPTSTISDLRTLLSKHDLKLQGVTKGRDISRLAIKGKDARIAELEARIAGLENARIVELGARIGRLEAEREVERAVIRELRAQVQRQRESGEVESQETIG